jgi:hypothetical protein
MTAGAVDRRCVRAPRRSCSDGALFSGEVVPCKVFTSGRR